MKRIANISRKLMLAALVLTAVSIAAVVSSCSKEFLEPDPLSFYEPTTTFNTESGLNAAMAICDRHIRRYWTDGGNIRVPFCTELIFSDMGRHAKTDFSSAGPWGNIAELLTPTSSISYGDDNQISMFWDESWNGIKYANTVITFVDKVTSLDEATKNAYKGRAYFHRAFRYMNLVFQFGNVPLITKIIEVPKQNYRSTQRDAILDMCVKDMEFAVEWVPDQKDMTYVGMVNKGACRMLLAKLYLATGEYDKAITQLNTLIDGSDYKLMDASFGTWNDGGEPQTWPITRNVIWDLHRPENKLIAANQEVILGMPNRGSDAESFVPFLAMRIFGPQWNNGDFKTPDGKVAVSNYARNNKNYNSKYDYLRAIGRGIATVRMSHFAGHEMWVVNGVEDRQDLRHNADVGNWFCFDSLRYNDPSSSYYGQHVMFYNPNDGTVMHADTNRGWFDYPHYKLFLDDVVAEANQGATQFNGTSNGGNGDWYLYRLAEAYLLRAEAKLYKGGAQASAEAAEDVNAVRRRANCSQLYTTVNIGDIMNERGRELWLEEWRNVELTRVSLCLARSGVPDEWGNTYQLATFDKQSGTDPTGGSYWYQRVTRYNAYNHGKFNSGGREANYTMDKRNIYWPIPNSAITANNKGKLAQNYGYDGYDPATPMWETWQEAVADEDKTE